MWHQQKWILQNVHSSLPQWTTQYWPNHPICLHWWSSGWPQFFAYFTHYLPYHPAQTWSWFPSPTTDVPSVAWSSTPHAACVAPGDLETVTYWGLNIMANILLTWYLNITSRQRDFVENMCNCAAITVPADGLAPWGARTSAGTGWTGVGSIYIHVYIQDRHLKG